MSREIQLTKGKVAIVDDADFEAVSAVKWYAGKGRYTWYARRDFRSNGTRIRWSLHRMLMGFPANREVDHVNGDGLDNRRSNLRVATRAQNGTNCKLGIDNTSGVKGVSFCRQTGKWKARLNAGGREIWLGRFPSLAEAKSVRQAAAERYHGEFANDGESC